MRRIIGLWIVTNALKHKASFAIIGIMGSPCMIPRRQIGDTHSAANPNQPKASARPKANILVACHHTYLNHRNQSINPCLHPPITTIKCSPSAPYCRNEHVASQTTTSPRSLYKQIRKRKLFILKKCAICDHRLIFLKNMTFAIIV